MTALYMKQFGTFLEVERDTKGLTQKELAKQLGVSKRTVSRWELGLDMPKRSLLIPLADCLGIMVSELLMGRRINPNEQMTLEQTDDLVKVVIDLAVRER